MKTLFKVLSVLCLVWLYCIAGAVDADTVSLTVAVLQVMIAAPGMLVCAALGGAFDASEKRRS